ncbi:MAG: DUF4442 domain-containing protein [Gammaproteobacteria bacterium]|nr:MAG: DUF4442 domain-containing protein [Gammaproteobacteria bacterium]
MGIKAVRSEEKAQEVNAKRFRWAQKAFNMPGAHFLTWLGTFIAVPYTSSIRPKFVRVAPGHFEIAMKKRRAVTNHMGTVHAAAMANLIELTASGAVQAIIPATARWIPSGMNIQYLKKAKTDLRSVCKFDIPDWHKKQDLSVNVDLVDSHGEIVAQGTVFIRLGPNA